MTNSNSDRWEFFSNSYFLGDFGKRCEIKAGCGRDYAEAHLQWFQRCGWYREWFCLGCALCG